MVLTLEIINKIKTNQRLLWNYLAVHFYTFGTFTLVHHPLSAELISYPWPLTEWQSVEPETLPFTTLMTVHLWHRFVWNVFGMWCKTNCTVQSVPFWTSKIFGTCSLNGAEITHLEQKNLVLSHVHIVYCCLNLIFGLHSRIFM